MPQRKTLIASLLILCTGTMLGPAVTSADPATELTGLETRSASASTSAGTRTLATIPVAGLLLIPDSTNDRVMAFDAVSGDLLDPDYIPSDPLRLHTPIEALPTPDGSALLVADQIQDVVRRYDRYGVYQGIFAPAGGPDTLVLDNVRGIAFTPAGHLLATVGSGGNAHAVAEFDAAGNFLGDRIAIGAGGLNSPFDVVTAGTGYLVSDAANGMVYRYDAAGAPLGPLAAIDSFPEQIAPTAAGGWLVASYSGNDLGVVELNAAGARIGHYHPAGLGGFRGVRELPGGHILTATDTGVYEIDRSGNLIDTKISGLSAHFISLLPPLAAPTPQSVPLLQPLALWLLSGLTALLGVTSLLLQQRRGRRWPQQRV